METRLKKGNRPFSRDRPSLETRSSPTAAFLEKEHYLVELLATMSHEFRTPLTVIDGYASTLRRHQHRLSLQEQDEYLQIIQEASKGLQTLTDRLFELAQLEAGTFQIEFRPVDVALLAREAIARVQQHVSEPQRNQLTFQLRCQDVVGNPTQEVPVIQGDARSLRKVLEQLLENALRFSPKEGRIDVIIQPVVPQTAMGSEPATPSGTSWLEICVCNTGISIPAEHLEHIFEPFYQIDRGLTRGVDGLGLGLTLCKYLVALHKGHIWAESFPSGGNALHVRLPFNAL